MDESPPKPGPPPSARPSPAPARPGADQEGEPSSGLKPTPVRVAAGGHSEGPELPPPSREFEVAGVPWIAVTAGAALSGAASDAAATVLLVLFRPQAEDAPQKEAMLPRRSLEELSELELLEAFESAVPFRPTEAHTEVFTETRRPGGSRR